MITREEAYARLAADPTHAALLKQLAEGWTGRRVVRVRSTATPEMFTRSDCAPYVERVTRGNLERKLGEEGADLIVGRCVRWYAAPATIIYDLDTTAIPKACAFRDQAHLIRWAEHASWNRDIAVCEAEATVIPALPELGYLLPMPGGTYEQRPGVA